MRLNDYVGRKFNLFTVVAFGGYKNHKRLWKCRCQCGKEVVLEAENLERGKPQSCGCARNPQSETFKQQAMERALALIEKVESCWIWTGLKKAGNGFYPYFNFNHQQFHPVKFFRLSLGMEPIPIGHCLRRMCHSNQCVNPEHYVVISISRLRYQNEKLKKEENARD